MGSGTFGSRQQREPLLRSLDGPDGVLVFALRQTVARQVLEALRLVATKDTLEAHALDARRITGEGRVPGLGLPRLACRCALLLRRAQLEDCLLYTSPSPRDKRQSRMPSSA